MGLLVLFHMVLSYQNLTSFAIFATLRSICGRLHGIAPTTSVHLLPSMTMDTPLISVILPVHNAEKYIAACIYSLLHQTYKPIEIIAIDDFSSDNSYTILQHYAKQDARLRLSRNVKHYGMALTLNRCMRQAKGKLIAFMNPKDISHPRRLEQQYEYLLANEKTVAVGVQCSFLNEQNERVGTSEFPTEYPAIYKKPLDGVSMLFENVMVHRHRIPKDVLYFKTNTYPFIYTDIVVKLLKYGELLNLPHVLYIKRLFAHNKHSEPKFQFPSLAKIWLRAATLYDHKVPLRSLFITPLLASLK